MNIVCASSVVFGMEAFSTLGDVRVLPDRDITRDEIRDADALVIRSKTRVDGDLVADSQVRFIGTCTAGIDHVDVQPLEAADIRWAYAPGCNANSVAEYVMAALLALAEEHDVALAERTLGVIGVGHIGSRVVEKAEILGMDVLQNDPPLHDATNNPLFQPLEVVLADADIVTLHVPLTRNGRHPTAHMCDCRFWSQVRAGCTFINTSRGEVVDEVALLLAIDRGATSRIVLDVWEHEPFVCAELLDRVDIGTPHIAGYSLEGRVQGTVDVYRQACNFFEVEPTWTPPALQAGPLIEVGAREKRDEEVLWEIVRGVYDIEADDRALREESSLDVNARGAHFVRLRAQYPERREFASVRVMPKHADARLEEKVARLGFQVVTSLDA